jgi:hypothetical protein
MQQWQEQNTILRRLGKAFHLYGDDIAHEPLPRRWVDLIHYLDEQEKLLCELMCTEEPTKEATALLEDLRRKVAQALAPPALRATPL